VKTKRVSYLLVTRDFTQGEQGIWHGQVTVCTNGNEIWLEKKTCEKEILLAELIKR